METFVLVNFVISVLANGVIIFVGFDLKKWYSWFCLFYGFLSGFFLGFLLVGVSLGLQLGAITTGTFFLSGVVTRWQRQYFGERLEKQLESKGLFIRKKNRK